MKNDELKDRARNLRLYGLLSNWDELTQEPWLPRLIEIEEIERHRRSLERRISGAHIGPFKPMSDFDWSWPKKISRKLIEELFTFRFISEGANAPARNKRGGQDNDSQEYCSSGPSKGSYRALYHHKRNAERPGCTGGRHRPEPPIEVLLPPQPAGNR
jgi:hypothetical protein